MKSKQEWIDEYAKLREENNMVNSISKLVDMVKTEFASQPPAPSEDVFAVTTEWGIKSHPTDLSNIMEASECLFIGTAYECACFIRDNKKPAPGRAICI